MEKNTMEKDRFESMLINYGYKIDEPAPVKNAKTFEKDGVVVVIYNKDSRNHYTNKIIADYSERVFESHCIPTYVSDVPRVVSECLATMNDIKTLHKIFNKSVSFNKDSTLTRKFSNAK